MGNLWERFKKGVGEFTLAAGNAVQNYVVRPVTQATQKLFFPTIPVSSVSGKLAAKGVSSLQEYVEENYDQIPYVWGGASSTGVDCSGFVQKVFRDLMGVEVSHSSKIQAGEIAEKFKLPLTAKRANTITADDIPPYCVISIKRPGTGHVLMVMADEAGKTVSWDSRGGSRNTASNPGKGVTEGSLQTLLSRLHREGNTMIDIVDTRALFANSGGVALTPEMFKNGWDVDLATKQKTLAETLKNAALVANAIDVRITTLMGQQALINRSTFIYSPQTGKPILNVAAGMSENWTKFSVITRIAEFEHKNVRQAMLDAAQNDPVFRQFLEKKELEKFGYGQAAFYQTNDMPANSIQPGRLAVAAPTDQAAANIPTTPARNPVAVPNGPAFAV